MKQKRRKSIRLRGSKTHGGGAMKKRRGAGNRGGRGHAGSGKRADQNKPKIWGDPLYFGKHGFFPPNTKEVKTCNLRFIEEHIERFAQEGKIKKEQDVYIVDLATLGYDKVLSSGVLRHKCKIIADKASASVAEKVAAAGGKLVIGEQRSAAEA